VSTNAVNELKRRLAAHYVNLANFTKDLEKSEKLRKEFVDQGDDLQSSLAGEVTSAHRKTIDHLKELIVKDTKALQNLEHD
jgi:hypothetical protein